MPVGIGGRWQSLLEAGEVVTMGMSMPMGIVGESMPMSIVGESMPVGIVGESMPVGIEYSNSNSCSGAGVECNNEVVGGRPTEEVGSDIAS